MIPLLQEYDERQLHKDLVATANLKKGDVVVIGFAPDGRPTRLVTVGDICEIVENGFSIEWSEGGRSYVHGDVMWRRATPSILRRAVSAVA